MKRIRRSGTTLVELLVVIVVFLIGILAILQIFPGGFRVLTNTRNNATARQLARSQMETIVSRADILPEMILPVRYAFIGSIGAVDTFVDGFPNPNILGIDGAGEGIDSQGSVLRGGNAVGRWDLVLGANRMRRVVGEGGRVPAPRQVGPTPNDFGGLMMLQFAPMSYNPAYPDLLTVYGNDMVRRFGEPGFRVQRWEYFVEDPEESTALIWLPQDTVNQRRYRLTMSAWISNGGSIFRRTIVDTVIIVPAGAGPVASFPLSSYAALQPGDAFVGAEFESIRVARLFEPVLNFTPNEPYEYRILDATLGILLFNPAGYSHQEVRPGRRIPLVARANYDVLDWRNIRDDFRLPAVLPLQQRLQLNSLKIMNALRPDTKNYTGLDILVADGAGGTEQRDILLLDMETGGVYTRDSFRTDTSIGMMTFNDTNAGLAGLQMQLILPGQAVATEVNASGRAVRALYQATGEWSVQVMMAPQYYSVTYSQPAVAQYYAGGSSAAGGVPTRIYFPAVDVGRKVVIGEIYYRAGANLRVLRDQDFVIGSAAGDPLGPHIDITSVDPAATSLDFLAYGYAVRRVKGASVAVRVLWNPAVFTLGGDPAENLQRFDVWSRSWRRTTVETFLQRGEN